MQKGTAALLFVERFVFAVVQFCAAGAAVLAYEHGDYVPWAMLIALFGVVTVRRDFSFAQTSSKSLESTS